MKKIKLTIAFLIIAVVAIAQKQNKTEKINQKVDKLNEVVNLSPEQRNQVAFLFESSHSEMKALRENGEVERSKMSALRQENKKKLNTILTEEQQLKLDAHHKVKKENKKAVRAEIKKYHQENVKPVVKAKRVEFEDILSNEDKKLIAEVRKMKQEAKIEPGQEMTKEDRAAKRLGRKEMAVLLQPLADKYATEFEEIEADLKHIMDKAEEHAKAVRIEYNGTEPERKRENNDKDKHGFVYHFLLMKP